MFESLEPGNYLLTKLEDGTFRVWNVDLAEAYFIDSDFDRLNEEADAVTPNTMSRRAQRQREFEAS